MIAPMILVAVAIAAIVVGVITTWNWLIPIAFVLIILGIVRAFMMSSAPTARRTRGWRK